MMLNNDLRIEHIFGWGGYFRLTQSLVKEAFLAYVHNTFKCIYLCI